MLYKIAAILAWIIGLMAIFAGAGVLLGRDPGYYVINWLPLLNYTLGVISVFTVAGLIWANHRLALPAAALTFAAQVLIMLALLGFYRDVVAPDSLVGPACVWHSGWSS